MIDKFISSLLMRIPLRISHDLGSPAGDIGHMDFHTTHMHIFVSFDVAFFVFTY
jgi:hypothetical protein